MAIATVRKLASIVGCTVFVLGCGGNGSPQGPLQVIATYDGHTSGRSATDRSLTGKVSIVVNADYTASMTVYDSTSTIMAKLSGKVNSQTGMASFEDSTRQIAFSGYFSPNSHPYQNRKLWSGLLSGVPSANGTWRNYQNGSSGKWSTLVPVITMPLTKAQDSALAAGVAGIFVPGAYGPDNTQSFTCPSSIVTSIIGNGPNDWGAFPYADSTGNSFIVVVKNYPPRNGNWLPNPDVS